jgi:ADP-ribose pyrophosphatase YjhB (NUDIX family)
MTTTVCYDPNGQPMVVTTQALMFSPAAYGIFVENNDVLLLRDTKTDLFVWPGAILQVGERPLQVVSRMYHLLTGVVPVVESLACMEDLYQVDGSGQAWHLSAMFYWLERPSATSLALTVVDSAFLPQMIPVVSIQRSQLQFGYQALQVARQHLKTA